MQKTFVVLAGILIVFSVNFAAYASCEDGFFQKFITDEEVSAEDVPIIVTDERVEEDPDILVD